MIDSAPSLLLILPILWYLAAKEIIRRSPFGKLAKTFPTSAYITLDESRSAQKSAQINIDGQNTWFPVDMDDIYVVGRPEGVLFCGPWIGQFLKLNKNFLIPWSCMTVSEEPVNNQIFPLLKSIRVHTYYAASIKTDIGVFKINLYEDVIREGVKAGFLSHLNIKT